ncbi:MAG: zinc ribbon domain-containing protein [Solobacterium sp.]|nr:zinc ribbon domain-containing protein [Solobacterium sp.]
MICSHCGKSIPNTAQTCPYCGKPVKHHSHTPISWYKFIALAGAVLVLLSAFIPAVSLNVSSIHFSIDWSDMRKWVMIVAGILSIIAMLVPSLELLYPVCTLFTGIVFYDLLKYTWEFFQMYSALRKLITIPELKGLFSLLSADYPALFLIGFLIMCICSIFVVLKYTIGRFFSKH